MARAMPCRNLRKPSRMLVRNWKHQWLPLCLAKFWRRNVGVVHPTKLKQDLRVFWKLVNPQDSVWKNLYQNSFTTALQFGTQIYAYASRNEDTRSRRSSGSRMGETLKDSGVEHSKSRKQIKGDRGSKDEGRKSSFCRTDGHLSFWRMPNWRHSTKNIKVELHSEATL